MFFVVKFICKIKNKKMNHKILSIIVAVSVLIVLVLGYIFFIGDINKKNVPTSDPTSSEKKSETKSIAKAVDTSNWKIYKNETFGYELKYPADWEIGTIFGADPYTFSAPDFSPANRSENVKTIPSFSISSIHKIAEGETVETNMPLGNPDGKIIEKKLIKIDGRDAMFAEYFKSGYGEKDSKVGRVQQQIKVIDAGVTYFFEMQEYNREKEFSESSASWENKEIFQAILDSFKFLENNQVNITLSGGITEGTLYTNEDFGFSVNLPVGWEKYKVSIQQDKGDDKHTYIYFLMPTTDKNVGYFDKKTGKIVLGFAEIFVVTATDLATWNKDASSKECLENPNPECPDAGSVLDKNDKYVFTANYGNGILPKDVQKFVESGSAAKFLSGKFKLEK